MRPIWVLEANVEGLPTGPLAAEITRRGLDCRIVKWIPSPYPKDLAGAEDVPHDACVIFRGTLTLMRHLEGTRRWRPAGWCEFDRLACSTYYAHFGSFMLNREYALLPYAETVRLSESLFARYGRDGRIFIRPDSVDKSFTGMVIDAPGFNNRFRPNSFDPTLPVLVARPKPLGKEWRLIIANGDVIAGSRYRDGSVRSVSPDCPGEAVEFVRHVLQAVPWRPAPVFIVDICESDEGLRVLELNSFGCSGHYEADVSVVVETAGRLAAQAW
jgi:hypothetical protein